MGIQLNGSSGADIISSSDGTLTIDGTSTVSTPIVTNTITISDKISHSGDSNTHIRFAGDDTVTVETAGSERLRIKSDGVVNIGDRSDNTWIDSTLKVRKDQNAVTKIAVRNENQGSSASSAIAVNAYGNSWMFDCGSAAKNSNALTIRVDATADGNQGTEKLRITTAGRLGIGDDNPASLLSLKDTNPTIRFTDGSTLVGAIEGDTTQNTFYGYNGADIIFSTHSGSSYADRLRINTAGDILLGTDQACIGCNTADGSDNRSFSLCGGSDASQNRGSLVGLFGNEHSSPGILALRAGNPGGSSGGHIEFSTGGSIRHYINKVGNIGLNMSPEAWHTNNQMVVQLSGSGGGMNIFTRASNSFLTTNFRYKSNDAGVFQASSNYALMYQLESSGGNFKWHTSTAASSSSGSSASMKARMVLEQDGSLVVGDRVGTTSPATNQPIAFHSARVNPDGGSAGIATGVRCNLYVGSNSGWASGDGGVLGLGGSASGTAGQERMWAYVHGRRQSTNGWEYGGTIDLGTADWAGSTTSKKMRIWSQGQCEYYPSDNTAYSLKYGSDVRLRFTHNSGNGNLTISNPSSGACVFDTSSDYRLKKDETAISNALTTVKALKPYQYTWKHSNELGQGFFAHEAQAVLPDIGVVSGTKDGAYTEDDTEKGQWKKDDPIYQGIDYSKLVPLLTAALQEATTKIETLETKVAALESS